jgi:hypothetical protein
VTPPLVLVVTHHRVQAVDAIAIIYLTICNNNGNNALNTSKYSARLTHLKPKENDTKEYERLSFSGLATHLQKAQTIMNKPF